PNQRRPARVHRHPLEPCRPARVVRLLRRHRRRPRRGGRDPRGRHLDPVLVGGNNKTWLELADRVILEVNRWQPAALEGMHDIYYGTALPPERKPIPLTRPDQRIGEPYLRVDPDKVVAVVETDAPDRNSPFS